MTRAEYFAFERSSLKLHNAVGRSFGRKPKTLKEYRLKVALDAERMNMIYGTTYGVKVPDARR